MKKDREQKAEEKRRKKETIVGATKDHEEHRGVLRNYIYVGLLSSFGGPSPMARRQFLPIREKNSLQGLNPGNF